VELSSAQFLLNFGRNAMMRNFKVPYGRKLEAIVIPPALLHDKKIDIYAKIAFGILLRDIDPHGRCSPSIKRLAGFLSCSEAEVQPTLNKLRAEHWIAWIDRPDGTRLYRLYSVAEHSSKEK
jgi:hypothetical protein